MWYEKQRKKKYCVDCGTSLINYRCERCEECRTTYNKRYHAVYDKSIKYKTKQKEYLLALPPEQALKYKIIRQEHYQKNKAKYKAARHKKHPPRVKQTDEEKEKKKKESAHKVYLKRKASGKFRATKIKYFLKSPQVKTACTLRTRVWKALYRQGAKKYVKFDELIGCSPMYLNAYLESKFKDGMTWDNYGLNGWHIDHIKPCISFNLTSTEEQKKCFNYTNLQPLWALDNYKKGASIINLKSTEL